MKIVVACGSGVATSTVIASKVAQLLKNNGITADIIQCTIHEVASNQAGASLIISSMPGLKVTTTAPVLVAFPYITGIGEEELDKKILDILKG
ncbi:MAG: PTS sugar transporter subunit IIB [Erysipelotrichaceae bacterium]|nr:PTS sugar transporter subunit IIB [Erysipelotrichaceae bacterium]MDY5728129.1 PTS sugar transporter subunit IIB [Erysipelotrichaceae bacterium]